MSGSPIVIRPSPRHFWRVCARNAGPGRMALVTLLLIGWGVARLVFGIHALDVLGWTLGAAAAMLVIGPMLFWVTQRIVVEDGTLTRQGVIRRRRVPRDGAAMLINEDGGTMPRRDPQLAIIGADGDTLLRVHCAYWPADLENRLRAAGVSTPQRLQHLSPTSFAAERSSATRTTFMWMLPIQVAFFAALGGWAIYDTLIATPATYDRLAIHGRPATATVASCTGGRSPRCELVVHDMGGMGHGRRRTIRPSSPSGRRCRSLWIRPPHQRGGRCTT